MLQPVRVGANDAQADRSGNRRALAERLDDDLGVMKALGEGILQDRLESFGLGRVAQLYDAAGIAWVAVLLAQLVIVNRR